MIEAEVLRADLGNPRHQSDLLRMVDMYARDPMGGGKPLPDAVLASLVAGLRAHPTTVVFLAYAPAAEDAAVAAEDAAEKARPAPGEPLGVAVAFLGFSTFAAKPLLNIHDLAVVPEHRGRGVGRSLLEAAEGFAREAGCCKLTLEVLANNAPARKSYHAFGFNPASYYEGDGNCLFYTKAL